MTKSEMKSKPLKHAEIRDDATLPFSKYWLESTHPTKYQEDTNIFFN
jgi:hypothetical protein